MVITNFKTDIYDYHRKSGRTGHERETWLNTKQVRELLNVCEGTLNLWAKRGYLVPVKVGNKNMYARSDVRRVQTGGKCESVTSYCKKRNG